VDSLSLGGLALVVLGAVRAEESLLVGRYPEYRDYAAKTRRMIPFLF
jgi:protein-S-isoprenylcysteine O-methyltransferase Ste14